MNRHVLNTIIFFVVLFGINTEAHADALEGMADGIRIFFILFCLSFVLVSLGCAALIHRISNKLVTRKRKSFWPILIGVFSFGIYYVWIEFESSYFEHHLSRYFGSFFAIFLPYILFVVGGGIFGFYLSPKKI